MNQSFWGYLIVVVGIIGFIVLSTLQNITTTDQHDYYTLKEVTEAAMLDALDVDYYNKKLDFKISKEKFMENFIRRYAEAVSTSNEYTISFYDIVEVPPKVSVRILTNGRTITNEDNTLSVDTNGFTIVNQLDAILETKY